MKSSRHARLVFLSIALFVVACDEPASQSQSSPPSAKPSAAALAAPPSAKAPEPAAAVAAPAKAKKKLEDCPKGTQVTFEVPAIETAVRSKLAKPQGDISKADLAHLSSLNLSQ